jgi:hypothetical protein
VYLPWRRGFEIVVVDLVLQHPEVWPIVSAAPLRWGCGLIRNRAWQLQLPDLSVWGDQVFLVLVRKWGKTAKKERMS